MMKSNSFLLFTYFRRYPIRYINRHFRKFLAGFSITVPAIASNIYDENAYVTLRRRILTIHTKSEHARANRIASQMDPSQINSTADPLIKAKLSKRQEREQSIIVHYTYERRFAHYKSKIHQIWNTSFPKATGIDNKLIVGTRNHLNLTRELVRRSPSMFKPNN